MPSSLNVRGLLVRWEWDPFICVMPQSSANGMEKKQISSHITELYCINKYILDK